MAKKSIYLAGPISGQSYEQARYGWRKEFTELLDLDHLDVLSPMRQEGHLSEILDISALEYAKHPWSKGKAIVEKDRFDVQNADMIIVYLKDAKRVSIGTMVEMGWADVYRKPIITVIEKDTSINLHDHVFVHELSTFVVHDLENAAHIANGLASKGL